MPLPPDPVARKPPTRQGGTAGVTTCVIAAYFAIAIAITWPLALNLNRVPADLGDPLMSIWLLWWNATVLPLSHTWWNGLAFFPAADTITLSDHRLGLGLITTPVLWAGASPVAAYNVAFVASFFLSALSAYFLCAAVSGSRLAGFVGGLIFGFNPYRAAHLEHLELLSSYWLPVMLLALHKWLETRRWTWLAGFSIAALLQALTSGYYFVFAMVLVGLWILWFAVRRGQIASLAALAVAIVAPLIAFAPVLYHYHEAHQRMGLRRGITEIERHSADLIGLLTPADRLFLWNVPASWQRPEGAILPGLLAVVIVVCAYLLHTRGRARDHGSLLRTARAIVSVLAAVAGCAALVPSFMGPVDFSIGPIDISISDSLKPLTLAIVFLTLLAVTSSRIQHLVRERSRLGFYVLATVAMWVVAFGPTIRFFGEPVFYKAPYAWLMVLPGFSDAFRAPARFAMLAALTLAVAAAIGFAQLLAHSRPAWRAVAAACFACGVLLESWIVPLRMLDAPPLLEIPQGVPAGAAIMEWPPGVYEDAAAMYRSMFHHRPTVNGLSGYSPPHYGVLTAALADGYVGALTPLAASRDIAVFVAKSDPETPTDVAALTSVAGAERIADTSTHAVLLVRQHAGHVPSGMPPEVTRTFSLESDVNANALHFMTDGDYRTAWGLAAAQDGHEQFVVDLGAPATIGGVVLASGDRITLFARELAIDVSPDKITWTEKWRGRFAAPSVAAALARPATIDVSLSFEPTATRYIRIRQLGRSREPWAVAEFAVIPAR